MKVIKQFNFKDKDTISASEIGQFVYCSMAWYLQKCGYKPESKMLDVGIKKHVELGRIMDYTQANMKRYKILATMGYLILILGILIFLFEVIL